MHIHFHNSSDPLATWALMVAAGSALLTALAVIASFIQARKAAQANEVGAFLDMQREYALPAMREAVSELSNFWRANAGEPIETAFERLKTNDPDRASEIRGYSRLVSSYFTNVARLHEAGLISKRLTRLMISHPGLNAFYDVAVPINRHKNPHHNSVQYSPFLKRICEKHGDGLY